MWRFCPYGGRLLKACHGLFGCLPAESRGSRIFWLGLILWFGWPGVAVASPIIRIMPLGDSITYGLDVPGGYRKRLYQRLSAAGYGVDFVGSVHSNGHPDLPDPDHEGHSALRIDQIALYLFRGPSWLSIETDMILLLVGTNDFGQRHDVPNAIHRLDALISMITTHRPNTWVVVGNLPLLPAFEEETQSMFNPLLPGLVNQHRAAGERVAFVDLHRVLDPEDLLDGAHPNETGHDKLGDAWFEAIQLVLAPETDLSRPPQLLRTTPLPGGTQVRVTFSKAVAAADVVNFSIDGNLSVLAAELDSDNSCEVLLTTGRQVQGVRYTITVNGVRDRTPNANLIAANSRIEFRGVVSAGALRNVPEAAGYQLIYSLDIPDSAAFNYTSVPYSVNRTSGAPAFSRIAYYLELQRTAQGELEFLYVSLDAFTSRVDQIGVPCASTGAFFQQGVTNLFVYSRVAGNETGVQLAEGSLEFWPGGYGPENSVGVPGASDKVFDSGDTPSPNLDGYGSMQIHHPAGDRVLFAYNGWGNGWGISDLGIGNNLGNSNSDWTFMVNAGEFLLKQLQVLVLPRRNGPPVTLRWPAQAATAVVLQRTESIAAGDTVWIPLTQLVSQVDGHFEVTLEAESAAGFFRLVTP